MHHSAAPAGVSAGLVNWRAGMSYAAPNATIPAFWLRPETGSVSADFCAVVPGTAGASNSGAFQMAVPDGTATGGDKRGAGAFDGQIHRNAAGKVATGVSSVQLGINNTTSGAAGICLGDSNVNVAVACSLIGANLISNTGSDYGSAVGRQGTLRGILGQHVHAGGNVAAQADCQYERLVQGTRALAGPNRILVAGAGVASTSNLLTCPNNTAMTFVCQIVGFQAGMANIYSSTIHGCIYRSGATIAFVGTPTDLTGGPFLLGTAGTWTVTATLDTTNFGFYIAFTSPGVFTQWTVITHAGSAT